MLMHLVNIWQLLLNLFLIGGAFCGWFFLLAILKGWVPYDETNGRDNDDV